MSYTIEIQSQFCASLKLSMPGPCGRLHGHTFIVRMKVVTDVLDQHGMVMDYYILKTILDQHLSVLDHQHLNDLPCFASCSPTCEHITKYLAHALQEDISLQESGRVHLSQLRISEYPGSWVTYTMSDQKS